jgi:3-oxoadipate enol-lactonase
LQSRLQYYQASGARLAYATLGQGASLVLLHPTPVHHAFWLPVASQLGDRYRILLPDFRGHGRSEGGNAIGIGTLAEDIERLLDQERIEAALFAGCSIGSYTLFELWRRSPQRIRGLAFCCGKPQPDSPENRAKRAQTIENIRRNGPGEFFDTMAQNLIGATSHRAHPEKSRKVRSMMEAMTAESAMAVQQGLADRPDSVPTVSTISVPVFALAGGEDAGSTPEEMSVIHQKLPGSVFKILPDAGHYAPYEQPQTVAAWLGEFFDNLENP